ncbi:MAG: hypothetical protein DHS80DRAFT_15931 [Piptocephalis tieghemiana]|nr:MAG: hypothetical protein DHS80DRAFT_15931 [Piptocephalis tieghemiana]
MALQLLITLLAGFFSCLLFSLVRRRIPIIYAPKTLNPTTRAKLLPLPDTFLGWIRRSWTIDEEIFLRSVGFDALVYLKFWTMGFRIFLGMSLVATVFLLPVHLLARPDPSPTYPNPPPKSPPPMFLDRLPRGSSLLVAHLLCTYLFTLIICHHLREYYRWFVHVRAHFLLHIHPGGHNRTVLVTGIPPRDRDSSKLRKRYQSLGIGTVDLALIVPETTYLQRCLITRLNALIRLERACASWCRRRKARTKALGERAPLLAGQDPTRTVRRLHPLKGWYWVDEVAEAAKAFQQADALVRGLRAQPFPKTGTGFIMFSRESYANAASQTLLFREYLQYITRIAPEKDDLYWPNVNAPVLDTTARRWMIKGMVAALVLFWAIPVSFVSLISSPKFLVKKFPRLEWILDMDPTLLGLLEGLLPTLAVSALVGIIPTLFRSLSQWQGHRTWSGIHAATFGKMYFFQYINVILVYTITGTITEMILELIEEPASIPSLLGQTLPRVAPFFLNFTLLQGLLILPLMQLIRVSEVADQLLRLLLARTPREKAGARKPIPAPYGHLFTLPVLLLTIGWTYSVMAPPILLAGLVAFMVGRIIAGYNTQWVYTRRGESGGRIWEEVFSRLWWSLILFQLSTAGILGLRGDQTLGLAVLPTLGITLAFWSYCKKVYGQRGKNLPLADIARGEEDWWGLEEEEGGLIGGVSGSAGVVGSLGRARSQIGQILTGTGGGSSSQNDSSLAHISSSSSSPSSPSADGGEGGPTPSNTIASAHTTGGRSIRSSRSWANLDDAVVADECANREGPMTVVDGVIDGTAQGFWHPAVMGQLPTFWVDPSLREEVEKLLRST